MHIEISYSGTERSDALDSYVREQITHGLGRFAERLTRVEAHVADENATKPGDRDKRCVLEARPRGMDPIVVTEEGPEFYAVIRNAAGKLGRALGTRFEKVDAVR